MSVSQQLILKKKGVFMDELMTISAVARMLYRSEGGVRNLANNGKLKCQRTSTGLRLFLASDVKQFIASGKNGIRSDRKLRQTHDSSNPQTPHA